MHSGRKSCLTNNGIKGVRLVVKWNEKRKKKHIAIGPHRVFFFLLISFNKCINEQINKHDNEIKHWSIVALSCNGNGPLNVYIEKIDS